MVYCHECGTKNEENAEYCSKCGSSLKESDDRDERYRHHHRDQRYRHRNECFGLPNGGMIVGLLFGILLILFGVSAYYGVSLWRYLWPIIIVIVGILIIAGAISDYARRR
jgi:uncharacterized membrane protein YvbJ